MDSHEPTKIGMKPAPPGEFIREEILEELHLSVARAAEILGVRRATLSDLVNGLLDLSKMESKIGSLALEPGDVAVLAAQVVRELKPIADQRRLRHVVPPNRLRAYDMRTLIGLLADTGTTVLPIDSGRSTMAKRTRSANCDSSSRRSRVSSTSQAKSRRPQAMSWFASRSRRRVPMSTSTAASALRPIWLRKASTSSNWIIISAEPWVPMRP